MYTVLSTLCRIHLQAQFRVSFSQRPMNERVTIRAGSWGSAPPRAPPGAPPSYPWSSPWDYPALYPPDSAGYYTPGSPPDSSPDYPPRSPGGSGGGWAGGSPGGSPGGYPPGSPPGYGADSAPGSGASEPETHFRIGSSPAPAREKMLTTCPARRTQSLRTGISSRRGAVSFSNLPRALSCTQFRPSGSASGVGHSVNLGRPASFHAASPVRVQAGVKCVTDIV
jgi:hypothetical protein